MQLEIDSLLITIKEKLSDRNVYFLWSGGDDSNLLLKIFLSFNIDTFCNLNVITIPYPAHVYSETKLEQCKDHFKGRKINYQILKTNYVDEVDITYKNACSVCKVIRRKAFLDYYLSVRKENDLIVTGHNLSDLMAYYIELCIDQMNMQTNLNRNNRFLEVTSKFLQSYQAEDNIEIFRPMIYLSQPQVQELLLNPFSQGIQLEIMQQKCKWLNQRKRLLQDYFKKANVVSSYETVCKLLTQNFTMPSLDDFRKLPFVTYLV